MRLLRQVRANVRLKLRRPVLLAVRAGCAMADASFTTVVYTNCSCLGNTATFALSGVNGFCPETCHDFFNYMAR